MYLNNKTLNLINICTLYKTTTHFLINSGQFGRDNIKIELFKIVLNRFIIRLSRLENLKDVNKITYFKNIRVQFHLYISGVSKPHTNSFSITKDGLPKILLPLKAYLKSRDKDTIRFVLTLLQISRILPGHKDPDFTAISDLGIKLEDSMLREFSDLIPELLQSVNATIPDYKPVWTDFHITTTMGPDGPSLIRSPSTIVSFFKRYKHLTEDMRAEDLYDLARNYTEADRIIWDSIYPPKFNSLRRLSIVKDNEGKSRVIAILDHTSQSLLKPLHDWLMQIIKSIKETDMTYDQDIKPFGPEDHHYYSFDLTSATDRFPIVLQKAILNKLIGEAYSNAWEELMVGDPFDYVDKGISNKIKYNCGQPLGAYSSWALFSLCHHLVIQFCARKVGKPNFRNYRLLGDDIVIRDDNVAIAYQEFLASIGVEISKSKSMVSKDTFEFAKRFFHDNTEVTGFPLSGFINTIDRWLDLTQIVLESQRRGYKNFVLNNIRELKNMYKELAIRNCLKVRLTDKQISKMVRNMYSLCVVYNNFEDEYIEECLRLHNIYIPCGTTSNRAKMKFFEIMGNLTCRTMFLDLASIEIDHRSLKTKFSGPSFKHLSDTFITNLPIFLAYNNRRRDLEAIMFELNDLRSDCKHGVKPWTAFIDRIEPLRIVSPEKLDSSRKATKKMQLVSTTIKKSIGILRDVQEYEPILYSDETITEKEQFPDSFRFMYVRDYRTY